MKVNVLILVVLVVLTGACTSNTSDSEQAQLVLTEFFERLSKADYAEAVKLYGGSYETLVAFNPDLSLDDPVALWQNGCQINGLQCLKIRIATFNVHKQTGEYIFTVQFSNPDGTLFVRPACCGEDPTTPPQFQFEYRVVRSGDGEFRVLDMPPYVP